MRACLLLWWMLSSIVPLYSEDSEGAQDSEKSANTDATDAPTPLEQLDARTRTLQAELETLVAERRRLATALAEQAAREKIEVLFRRAEEAAEAGNREEAEAIRRQALGVQEELLKALYSKSQSPRVASTSDASRTPSPEKGDGTSAAAPPTSREADWERHYWNVEAAEEPAPHLPDELAKDSSDGNVPEELDVATERDSRASTKRAHKGKGQRRKKASRQRQRRSYSKDDIVRDRVETVEAVLRILTRPAGAPPAQRGPSRHEVREMRKVLRQLRAQLDHLDARLDAFERG